MGRRKPDSRTAKPDRSRLERRRLIVGVLCFLWFGCIAARLYYFQVIQYVELLARAQRQQQHTIEVAPERGVIYDRQMNPLAMSLAVDSVYAVPSELTEPQDGGFCSCRRSWGWMRTNFATASRRHILLLGQAARDRCRGHTSSRVETEGHLFSARDQALLPQRESGRASHRLRGPG